MLASRRLSLYDKAMADGGMTQMSGTPAIISAGLYFNELPSDSAIEALVKEQILSFDSLSGQPIGGRWEKVGFDASKHILHHELDNEQGLIDFTQATMSAPLANREKGPWWEIHVCQTRDPSSRSMLFFRVEHACADGMAILQVLSRVATTVEGEPLPPAVFNRPKAKPVSWWSWLCSGIASIFKYLNLPLGPFDSTCAFKPSRPCQLLKFGHRQLVVVPPHSLNTIKRTKWAIGNGTTVNDVCYAAFAGAIRRYCEQQPEAVALSANASLRALVPVAFPRSMDTPLTNDWCFVSTPLPVTEPSALQRVSVTNQLFSALKASPEVIISKLAIMLNATMPPCLFGLAGQNTFSRHSVVFSNVPGPSQPIAIGGKEVVGLLPAFPNLIPQVLCVSYHGKMWMTLTVDPEAVKEPTLLSTLYLDELRQLAIANGVDPDDGSEFKEPPKKDDAMAKRDPRELV